ncbi:uncharacterized protein MYCFIDRAFT_194851 [Pseudocercospora fijiensis CIRAD86]|uniref:Uncharacterized protein n=1 Tax=Pseudocercospora fijiensis (strain CIRAD86) TaxID=383855 RepID=M3BCP4_PSEFD|nr:uncharacterized protein MYCFIDRAFT_194851 [Pseudocercospora fijiensis CIRAD86]EME86938.1 hypothetical protein MYCFIDRAFT_194851 [Pseudocercospora fijiensis CIRAD86]
MADRKRRLSTHPEESKSAKRQASDAQQYLPQVKSQVLSAPDLGAALVNATRTPRNQTNAIARSSPRWDSKLRADIRQAAQSKPRFLFRAILVNSEDLAEFSDDGELVPSIVGQYDETIEDFYSNPLEDMTEIWYCNPAYEAYFTKWTPSMFKAISKALYMLKADGAGYDVHLATLDTKRLSSSNLTVGRAALQNAFSGYLAGIPVSSSSAYLVYGIISQEAFCTRPLKALNNKHVASGLGYKLHHRPLNILKTSLHNASPTLVIDIAREFGKVFDGDGFALPATVMAIATLCHDRDSSWPDEESLSAEIVTALQDFPIQSDWKHDSAIMTMETHTFDQAADRGLRLLRALADRRAMGHAMRAPSVNATDLENLSHGILQVKLAADMAFDQSVATHDSTSDYEPVSPSSIVPEEFQYTRDDPAEIAKLLPAGSMDDETKRHLLKAQKYTPRYLFRGWNNGYRPSGGHRGLNTVDAITPLAYLKDREAGTSSIYNLSRDQLRTMCFRHLGSDRTASFKTELSSWASSLRVAMLYSRGQPDSYISIIDTRALQEQNIIVHVPQLGFLLFPGSDGIYYPEEYLAHGVIEGSAHKAVPLEAFTKIGICQTSPWLGISHITAQEIIYAKTVADQYGPRFGTAVLIAILCTAERSSDLWKSGIAPRDLTLIASAISAYKVPQRLCADDTILKDLVYTKGFSDVEQMIRLLRAVVDWRHGKGARGRKQIAKWEDSASLLSRPSADAEEDAPPKEHRKRRSMRRSRK